MKRNNQLNVQHEERAFNYIAAPASERPIVSGKMIADFGHEYLAGFALEGLVQSNAWK